MAPTTRRRAAQLVAGDNNDQVRSEVDGQASVAPSPVRKGTKLKKDPSTSNAGAGKSASTTIARRREADNQTSITPSPVGKGRKLKKDTKTSKVAASKSANLTLAAGGGGVRKTTAKYDQEGDGKMSTKGFVPNALLDTANELSSHSNARSTNRIAIKETEKGLATESVTMTIQIKTQTLNTVIKGTQLKEETDKTPRLSNLEHTNEDDHTLKSLHKPNAETVNALEIPEAAMPTLTTDIHDIWDRCRHDNWKFHSQLSHNDDWRIYETLTPAIRLASLWLTRPEFQGFWTAIFYGPLEPENRGSSHLSTNCSASGTERHSLLHLTGEPVGMTPKLHQDMEKRLRDVARKTHFRFAPLEATKGQWARTETISRRNSDSWRGDTFAPGFGTTLHDDFMYIPWPNASPPVWKESSTCVKLRFLFLLAVQLGGQLAELLWMDRCQREKGEEGLMRRACFSVGNIWYHRMSDAFESLVLGGRLQIINNLPSPLCLDGLAVTAIEHVGTAAEVELLSMHEISARFSSAWWAERDNA
ncbi:MAG: hypothetical protein L6R39_001790 [Caloplaca ligustica]|nr:MAG: hypothetical protein L6R39_001790 [Caloplaca ligustica]